MAFAFLSLMALLPLGMQNNAVSIEQTHAVGTISMLEADLRYTHPAYTDPGRDIRAGESAIYGLPLPYEFAVQGDSGSMEVNGAIREGQVYSVGITDNGELVDIADGVRTRYQISVTYTNVPNAVNGEPVEALLTVSWPSQGVSATSEDLIDPRKVDGYVEGFVSFPTP
ncbi:MAG: hypothetical protein AAGK14_11535 [Verrucomicrobiota bacterium]